MDAGRETTIKWSTITMIMVMALCVPPSVEAASEPGPRAAVTPFLELLTADGARVDRALGTIESDWQDGYTPLILEILRFSRDPAVVVRLVGLLEEKTGQDLGYDVNRWYEWLWNREEKSVPYYGTFKSVLYGHIDPRFSAYFSDGRPTRIRLDEIVWGGVLQDGIPPLRSPKMIAADEARYLADDNIVFGLAINGDSRAYPKRILAWHEMFVDVVGGVPVTGAYCTLCGSMILYKSKANGSIHRLGTSGFLYRSNKLMYDQDTQTLWNTLWGTPVLGPLVDKDIRLERLSVVTTTWGEWRRRHPDTSVLSLDTGHVRDYSEGAAYRQYFATDELMFAVPKLDRRLANKGEVLGLIFPQHPDEPLAISAEYLSKHPVLHERVGEVRFVVLTDRSGANRVYEAQDVTFTSWNGEHSVVDGNGDTWHLTESDLRDPSGRSLYRLPAHRAFWFGWYSAYSHSRLLR
jgi:hypothetical protein